MMHFHKRASAAAEWQQELAPHPHELFLKVVELACRMNVSSASGLTSWSLCCVAASSRVLYAGGYSKAAQWKNTYALPYVPVSREDLNASSTEAPTVAKKRSRPEVKRREAGQGSEGNSKARTFGQQLEEAASSSSTSFAPIEIAF
ncbi:hypothetical protein CF326_g8872 [Tilletia indica]|nr:hypothetical protein CF326_g8872 [Tilletia indica]